MSRAPSVNELRQAWRQAIGGATPDVDGPFNRAIAKIQADAIRAVAAEHNKADPKCQINVTIAADNY